jgi:hypothetical protein
MASTYVIKLSHLDLVRDVHIPVLTEEVRKRRTDLGEALATVGTAFEGELFGAPRQAFRDAVDAIQDLQTETIRRLEMGAEGVGQVVRHHRQMEDGLSAQMRAFEDKLPKLETAY